MGDRSKVQFAMIFRLVLHGTLKVIMLLLSARQWVALVVALVVCSIPLLVARSLDSHLLFLNKANIRSLQNNDSFCDRPPLSELIGDNGANITGDVQFLLDFAIIAHPKTGTTEQLKWISKHEEVQAYPHEVNSLKDGKPAEFVRLMYELPTGKQYKRGYKAPRDIIVKASREALRKYWPKTKLIVGVRHPVLWFESWYNHQTRGHHPHYHGANPAVSMVGDNLPEDVRFHQNLAMLGKTTPHGDPLESTLLGFLAKNATNFDRFPNEVFLYEISQPFDPNRTRAETYSKDLSHFLGLSKPLLPLRHSPEVHDTKTIDVCDEKFTELREELMKVGKAASEWIQKYFMELPNVTVSSPDHFKEILKTWLVDPCDQRVEE